MEEISGEKRIQQASKTFGRSLRHQPKIVLVGQEWSVDCTLWGVTKLEEEERGIIGNLNEIRSNSG